MRKQTETLHYHEYCIGHGFQKEIDEKWETCSQCGDTSSRYVFSFDNEDEFIEKYLDEYLLVYPREVYESLPIEQLIGLLDPEIVEEEINTAKRVYKELYKEEPD